MREVRPFTFALLRFTTLHYSRGHLSASDALGHFEHECFDQEKALGKGIHFAEGTSIAGQHCLHT